MRGQSKTLHERTLLLLELGVNVIAAGPGEPVTLQASRKDVEMDMRHGLPRRTTILSMIGHRQTE